MSWTFCSSFAAIAKAGANANADIVASGAVLSEWSDEAEGTICLKTRKDWITSYPTSSFAQHMLADACSDLVAIKIISYDQSGFLKGEAGKMLDVLKDNYNEIIRDLREKEYQEKIS